MHALEGALDLRIRVSGQNVQSVELSSTRPVGISSVLRGKTVDEALAMLPRLFTICGNAHAFAGLEAVEAALEIRLPTPHVRARDFLRLAETLKSHAWFFLLDWPRREGKEPMVADLAILRSALEKLPDALYPDKDWCRPGGGVLSPDRDLVAELLGTAINCLNNALGTFGQLSPASGTIGAVFKGLRKSGLSSFGKSTGNYMTELDRAVLSGLLENDLDQTFIRTPSIDGNIPETGPLARMALRSRPHQDQMTDGDTLATRLRARLDELILLMDELPAMADALEPGEGSPLPVTGSGQGLGVTEAARGRLTHWVAVQEGRIDRYAILAPTEWNFHPEGPLVKSLYRETMTDPARFEDAVQMLVTAMDPCVTCHVSVEYTS